MGGKSYYCDYCDNHMKNDINVRKKHIDGLPHKIAKANYMRIYGDPKEILLTESQKSPCTRFFLNGQCKFGLFCHFSHYTKENIEELEILVSKESIKNPDKIVENVYFPWKLNKMSSIALPPSLQPINCTDYQITAVEWSD